MIETLIIRRRMRRYKKKEKQQQQERPLTDLERRLALEEQLRADPVVLDLVLAGRYEQVRDRIAGFQPGVTVFAVRQLELQLRHEVVRTGLAVEAASPDEDGSPGRLDAARVQEVLTALTTPASPLRALAEFEPVSRRFRKTVGDQGNLLDRPDAAVAALAEIRRCGLHSWVVDRLGGPVVLTLETAGSHPVTAETGIGCAITASGEVLVLAPGELPSDSAAFTVWFFLAAAVPDSQAGVLV